MMDPHRTEFKILVIGYSPKIEGGVTRVTQTLMKNFSGMQLLPSLYCYRPKHKALLLYLRSIMHFIFKLYCAKEDRPDFIVLIIGSRGDIIRSIPFIWLSRFSYAKLLTQYHTNRAAILLERGALRIFRHLILKSFHNVNMHLFLSKHLERDFRHLFPYKIRAAVIPNALEKDWIDIDPLPLSERDRDIVFLGRWNTEKGVNDLVKCMRGMPTGVTCEIYTNYILDREYPRCKFHRWIGHEEVKRVISTAKLVVLPSYFEAFPTVLLEAAACGTPFVASDVGGTRDIARESGGGVVFPPGNVTAFRESIIKIIDSPEMWYKMSKSTKSWVRSLSEDLIKEKWLSILSKM